jgi:primase-polymerase (primpol)-like protein
MMRMCERCGKGIDRKNSQARFCSSKCRVYTHRDAQRRPSLPIEMTGNDRWVRWDRVRRDGKWAKVPFTIDAGQASSTNPLTWTSYAAASASSRGVGLGFVLGNGIGCIDLDHCLIDGQPNEPAAAFLARYPGNLIEVSPSGDGLHIWGLRHEQPGTKRLIDGLSVETYSTGRYITVTGKVYQQGSLLPL